MGDIAILAKYIPHRIFAEKSSFIWELFGGAKLPTRDTDRFKELQEEDEDETTRIFHRHGASESSSLIGGDDLTLGSGSYDWILGSSFFGQVNRCFLSASAQYNLRQEGDYDFEFGDDFQWNAGPGVYLQLSEEDSLSLRLRLSGEMKAEDRSEGLRVDGSSTSRLFLGPELRYTLTDLWFVSAGIDFAMKTESAADGVVPRYRSQLVVSRKFRT